MADRLRKCIFIFLILSPLIVSSQDETNNFIDVALNKKAWQSSTQGTEEAKYAVDGNVNTCSGTLDSESSKPWWQVNLGKAHTITKVTVRSKLARPLDSFKVFVGNNEDPKSHLLCRSYKFKSAREEVTLECFQPMQGAYVSIQGIYQSRVYICDIQIFECKDEFFGKDCRHTCHCEDKYSCDKVSGSCGEKGVCESGYHGNTCQAECQTGKYGPNCVFDCHCAKGNMCNRTTGECPDKKCARGWYLKGKECQIHLPLLTRMPKVERKSRTNTSITLLYHQWEKGVDIGNTKPDMYLIQYKYYKPNTRYQWVNGPVIPHKGATQQRVLIPNLNLNTRYIFRIVPIVQSFPRNYEASIPESHPTKTRCSEPDAPVVESVNSYQYDKNGESFAAINIGWKNPSKKRVRCDNIKFFKIYQKLKTADKWTGPFYALHNAVAYNITTLKTAAEYLVKVSIVNNADLENSTIATAVMTVGEGRHGEMVDSVVQSNSAIVAGVVIMILLILVALGVALFLRQRYRRKYKSLPTEPEKPLEVKYNNKYNNIEPDNKPIRYSSEPPQEKPPPKPPREKPISETDSIPLEEYDEIRDPSSMPPEEPKYKIPGSPNNLHLVKVQQLESYISKVRENEEEGFKNEYKEIPFGLVNKCDIGKKPENKHKNRFVNIIPYDHSRVKLDTFPEDPDSDYINANFLDGYQNPKAFIATQGVNKYTVSDLWRMVWQFNAHRIVMVTNLVENGKRKCEPYWPEEGTKQFGEITVENLEVEITSDFVLRCFRLKRGGEYRMLKHFLFTSWPDHGVPTQAAPLIAFRKKVRLYDQADDGPIVLHCSAGVGRTGTFIALDYLLDQAKAEGQIDVYSCVQQMRKNRVNMIQTVEQYIFVYDALLEALTLGETGVPCSEYRHEYEVIRQVSPGHTRSKLEEQFEMLQTTSPILKPEDCSSAMLPENEDKNRYKDLLPANRYRPYLMTRVAGRTDYINAVFADGFKKRNAFLLTQMPLPGTVVDFWRMVYEHHSSTVVMLNDVDPMDPKCAIYWCNRVGTTDKIGCFDITLESMTESNGIIQREFKMAYDAEMAPVWQMGQEPHTVRQFQLKTWLHDDHLPESPVVILNLLLAVEEWQNMTRNGPITLHCMNGASRSGIFAVIMCVIEKMKADQEVDVFQTVKQLRRHRPQIIENLEQYHFCHQVALEYYNQVIDKSALSTTAADINNTSQDQTSHTPDHSQHSSISANIPSSSSAMSNITAELASDVPAPDSNTVAADSSSIPAEIPNVAAADNNSITMADSNTDLSNSSNGHIETRHDTDREIDQLNSADNLINTTEGKDDTTKDSIDIKNADNSINNNEDIGNCLSNQE